MEPQKRLFWRFVVISIALSMLFTASAVIGYKFRLIEKADLTLYDFHFRWRGAQSTSGNVVLVLMDQKSAQSLHRKRGMWSRFQMADALNNLCDAGADVIGLDMVFFAPSHLAEEDHALAEAIEDCGNVVLAKFVAVEGRGGVHAPVEAPRPGASRTSRRRGPPRRPNRRNWDISRVPELEWARGV